MYLIQVQTQGKHSINAGYCFYLTPIYEISIPWKVLIFIAGLMREKVKRKYLSMRRTRSLENVKHIVMNDV